MQTKIRAYRPDDLPEMIRIWNQVVSEADAFPQVDLLDASSAREFFSQQDFCGIAYADNQVLGLYILHANNIGRCGHIANTSYAVDRLYRGKKIGEKLVRHSLTTARTCGYRLMQFNAVVSTNIYAVRLYEKLGFQKLGLIPGGFRLGSGQYADILLYYIQL